MDPEVKKTTLRMIPYGLYVLTAESASGEISAATVSWVTQASFQPPLIALGVKADSASHRVIKETGAFALNFLKQGQEEIAQAFIKETKVEGDTISGEPYRSGGNGAPILQNAAAYIECRLVDTIERGDHSVFVGEVLDASIKRQPVGRPDEQTLRVWHLGKKVFYGG